MSTAGSSAASRYRSGRCSASSTARPAVARGPSTAVRGELRRLAAQAGVRRRFAPHQLRHGHAVELAREGVPVNIIQRQLGHSDLGTTSTYLQGIDPSEIVNAVHSRRPPMMPASAALGQ
ncbi:MAG: tyrosine-type recombinase/integrase [Solirubrobacteraceae bacterium]